MESKQLSEEEKEIHLWGTLCHVSAFLFILGIPFGNILGPLIVWMVKKDYVPLVREHGKEAVNFQLSIITYAAIIGVFGVIPMLLCHNVAMPYGVYIPRLAFAYDIIPGIFIVILAILLPILWVVEVVRASIAASEGKLYKYHFSIHYWR